MSNSGIDIEVLARNQKKLIEVFDVLNKAMASMEKRLNLAEAKIETLLDLKTEKRNAADREISDFFNGLNKTF